MEKERKKKIKKITLITTIVILAFYLIGGILASFIVNNTIFQGSTTSLDLLNQYPNTVFKTRDDYPLLANRIEHQFKSGNNTLYGYYYDVNDEKGLVISAHGINNLADGSNAQMHNYFVSLGYDVFAIDLTGSGRSEGRSTVSLSQSVIDIKNAYQYLKNNALLKDNLILMGHSWGAYGVTMASSEIEANKVIAFSTFNRPIDLMFDMAEDAAGFLAYLTYPTFIVGNLLQYGTNPFKKANAVIKKKDETQFLIIQGDKDNLLPYEDTLYHKTLGYQNVTSLLLNDIGHDYPWLDLSAVTYINSLDKETKKEDVDLEKSSQISPLVDLAIRQFLNED